MKVAHRSCTSGLSVLMRAPVMQSLTRGRTAALVVVVLVSAVVLIDIFDVRVRPQPTLPPAAYALSMLVAASFLTPVVVAGVAAFSLVAQLAVAWHHQAPIDSVAVDQSILVLVGVLAVLYSARIRAETTLKAEREVTLLKLETVFQEMVEGVVIIDGSGALLSMNPAALRHFGMWDGSLLIGPPWQEVAGEEVMELRTLDGRLLPIEEWPASRILRGENVEDMDVVVRHRQTGGTWVGRFNGRMARTSGSHASVGVLTIRDVTSDKQVEALRTSEERFRLIAASSPDIIFHQDRDMRYSWVVNPAPPFDGDELIGKTDFDLFPSEEARHLFDLKRRVLENGAGVKEEVALTHGESVRHFDLVLEPWRDRDGAVVGLAGYGLDVTERKLAQTQLLEQQRSVAALQERSRLARELHDSLAQVLSYVVAEAESARQLLSQKEFASAGEYLDLLCGAARDAVTEVRDFIGGAKSGQSSQLFANIAKQLQQLEQHGLRTELSVSPGVSEETLAEPVRFQLFRIIQESLANVRKHSSAASVRVVLARQGEQLDVTIEDDGRGFDPDLAACGTGKSFGLLIMRERAEEAGGSFQVVSAPGRGTKVFVQVPVWEAR